MSRPSEFSSMGPPICFMFCSIKSTFLHTKDDYLKSDMEAQTRHLCHSVCVCVCGRREGERIGWLRNESINKTNIYDKVSFQIVLNEALKSCENNI